MKKVGIILLIIGIVVILLGGACLGVILYDIHSINEELTISDFAEGMEDIYEAEEYYTQYFDFSVSEYADMIEEGCGLPASLYSITKIALPAYLYLLIGGGVVLFVGVILTIVGKSKTPAYASPATMQYNPFDNPQFRQAPVIGGSCPNCGKTYTPGTKFCANCGFDVNTPLTATEPEPAPAPAPAPEPAAEPTPVSVPVNYCPACGNTFPAELRFCTNCGTPLRIHNENAGATTVLSDDPYEMQEPVPAPAPEPAPEPTAVQESAPCCPHCKQPYTNPRTVFCPSCGRRVK